MKSNLLNVWRMLCVALALAGWMVHAHAAATPSQALIILIEAGDSAVSGYQQDPAHGERLAAEFSRLYFDVFEAAGVELVLGSKDRSLMQQIELGFARCIQTGIERRPTDEARSAWGRLRSDLIRAMPLVADGASGAGTRLAWQAGVIVLREGLEALLVVSALAAFLRRSGQEHRLRWLWAGVALGVAASGLLAWAVADLLAVAGTWRGALQGVMVTLAAIMIAQMAAWMYARRSAERWNQVLREHMAGALDGTPWLTLLVSFVAVFREGAETMLFFHALGGSAPGHWLALAVGSITAALVLAAAFMGFQRVGRRMPYSAFFIGTASLLLVIALVFAGKGALYLQMAGWLPSTEWTKAPSVGWLGIYPLRETVFAQVLLFGWVMGMTFWSRRPHGVDSRQASERGAQSTARPSP